MPAEFHGPVQDGAATPEQQRQDYGHALERELLGLERSGKTDRIPGVKAEMKRIGWKVSGKKERATVATEEAEQATA
jgi:hypothetical protein